MDFNKKIITIAIACISISFLGACSTEEQGQQTIDNSPKVSINNIDIPGEIVDTAETRRLGLSYREILEKDTGMLFDMQARAVTSFWMKEMNFPLDIIWIDGNEIMHISENLPPAGSRPDTSYSSEFSIDYVLEVNGEFCEKNGIKVGDEVIFKL